MRHKFNTFVAWLDRFLSHRWLVRSERLVRAAHPVQLPGC